MKDKNFLSFIVAEYTGSENINLNTNQKADLIYWSDASCLEFKVFSLWLQRQVISSLHIVIWPIDMYQIFENGVKSLKKKTTI